jgi:hypothetical protein
VPCDTVQTTTVDLGKANPDILKAALEQLGITRYTFKNGVVTVIGSPVDASVIKQAYSKQIVFTQAKRFGWGVKTLPDGKLQILKARL